MYVTIYKYASKYIRIFLLFFFFPDTKNTKQPQISKHLISDYIISKDRKISVSTSSSRIHIHIQLLEQRDTIPTLR